MCRRIIDVAHLAAVLSVAYVSIAGAADGPPRPPHDLTEVSLEYLMDIEVTSVSKREQKLSQTTAAIYVISLSGRNPQGGSFVEYLPFAPSRPVVRRSFLLKFTRSF